jgi:hypothetical protein
MLPNVARGRANKARWLSSAWRSDRLERTPLKLSAMRKLKTDLGERPSLMRRAIYAAAFGALGGALGAIVARPLVAAFRDSAPWVLPVLAAALVGALVPLAFLLPLWFRRR